LLLRWPWQPVRKSTAFWDLHGEEAVDHSINWPATIIRWFAMVFSAGTWVGIVFVALNYLD
jgi:hypothetical protein